MLCGLVIGALVAAVVAVILALATQKLSGFYLAAVTLLFGIASSTGSSTGPDFTRCFGGISGVEAVTLFGWQAPRYTLVVLAILFAARSR